jgi:hypothetical protein
MSYPGPGPIYRHGIMCGWPFRIWKCELLRNGGKFCTVRCYSASRRAFSEALADGGLEHILKTRLSQEGAEGECAGYTDGAWLKKMNCFRRSIESYSELPRM